MTSGTATPRSDRRGGRATLEGRRLGVPGVLFLEIDGLAHDVLRAAMRRGNAPTLAAWMRDGQPPLIDWESDWSSQTGALPGGDPARLQLRHAGLPLVGEGPRRGDRHEPSA